MTTTEHEALLKDLQNVLPTGKHHILTDDEGIIESITVFVENKITGLQCARLYVISQAEKMDLAIRPSTFLNKLIVEFNK